jgi:hypothetical protein
MKFDCKFLNKENSKTRLILSLWFYRVGITMDGVRNGNNATHFSPLTRTTYSNLTCATWAEPPTKKGTSWFAHKLLYKTITDESSLNVLKSSLAILAPHPNSPKKYTPIINHYAKSSID